MHEHESLTLLIERARGGDGSALDRVFREAYDDLHALARSRLDRGGRNTLLDTTALVHESYLRLLNARRLEIRDQQHFLRYAAHVMRSVVVDLVRERRTERRGGQAIQVTLDTGVVDEAVAGEEEILRVHDALEDLARFDRRLVEVVEMRYFAGMTEAEVATALAMSERTVRRDWEKAKLLLAAALR